MSNRESKEAIPLAKYRRQRINDSVAQETSLILRDVKDPRVSDALITITGADVSADLKYAKIYFSLYGGDVKETEEGLRRAAGFIRGQLARRLNLRITPELTFVYDMSVGHGAQIASILRTLDTAHEPQTEPEKGSEEKDDDAR